jgi:hypothetical protein
MSPLCDIATVQSAQMERKVELEVSVGQEGF